MGVGTGVDSPSLCWYLAPVEERAGPAPALGMEFLTQSVSDETSARRREDAVQQAHACEDPKMVPTDGSSSYVRESPGSSLQDGMARAYVS